MGKVTKKEMPIWEKMGHGKPRTRREFLGYGLIPFAARVLMPGALGLLTAPISRASAAECEAGAAGLPAVITLNLSGGASLASNYMALDLGGAPLASYSKIGNGSGANIPERISEFGNPNFSANSQFVVGVRTFASADALARTAFVAGCVQSRDDFAENPFDISGLAYQVGLSGKILPNIGTRGTPSGIQQKPATVFPPSPLVVSSFTTVQNSIGYTAALKSSLNDAQRNKVAQLASRLSGSQARRLASISSAAHVQNIVECAGIKNVELISNGASAIDPLLAGGAPQGAAQTIGQQIGALYGINAQTAANNEQRVFSTLVYNALVGNSGTVNLERGGYDYHDGTRTTGDTRDREAGEAVGRMLQMAHLLQRPVFIYVTSDGSTVSTDSASAGSSWVSDRGAAGMMYLIAYRPAGRPSTSGPQIGGYTAGQEADGNSAIGTNPEAAAQAAFANYCRFAFGSGWETQYRKVIPRGGSLEGTALESVLKITG